MSEEEIVVPEEGQQKIIDEWNSRKENPPSLKELVALAFPHIDEYLQDGRSKYGKAVKKFLASRDIKAKAAHEQKGREIKLSEEDIKFLENNRYMMNALEMAKVLFKDESLTNLHQEVRVITEYLKSTSPTNAQEEVPQRNSDFEYKVPKTQYAAIQKVNKYVLEGINKDKITTKDKKNIDSLIAYLHTYRFLHQISNYTNDVDRDLFESSFVRYTHDKSDLTQEEVDQYIVLSSEVVIASNIQRRVEHLQRLLDNAADDSEGRRISMGLVESINTAQNEYHQSVNRQNKLLSDLKEKRSDRLKNQIKENASIINLVQLWKEEESRHKLIKLAELRKKSIKDEVEKLSTMDEVKARIMGITEDEVLNG